MKVKSRSVLQLIYISKTGKEVIREYPLRDLEGVLVIGRGLLIESSVLSVLPSMNIPVSIIARDSVGILINPVITVTNNYRRLQYGLDKAKALTIALQYLKAKINGMINILKYYRITPPPIPEPPMQLDDPEDYEYMIRVWEATASKTLWQALTKTIRPEQLDKLVNEYNFSGRKPRHPDPFNKTLSVMYSVLYTLATKALLANGLDPTHGLLHRTKYSTPLTFDYTEMFKPIAMQATIDLINSQGLPELGEDGELTRESVNRAIRTIYQYLSLRHKDTKKTPYRQIHLKAFCLAKHLEGKCSQHKLTVTWDRSLYRQRRRA